MAVKSALHKHLSNNLQLEGRGGEGDGRKVSQYPSSFFLKSEHLITKIPLVFRWNDFICGSTGKSRLCAESR